MKIVQKLFCAFAVIIAMASCSDNAPDVVLPVISIDDVTAAEGGTLLFTVSINTASKDTVTFSYKTEDVTTTSADFSHVTTATAIMPGQTSVKIVISAKTDAATETDETFKIILSNAKNAQISDSEGLGTITNVVGQTATYYMRVKIGGAQWNSIVGGFFGAEFIGNTFAGYGTEGNSQLSFIFKSTPTGVKTYAIIPDGATSDDNVSVYYSPTFFSSGGLGQSWIGQAAEGEFKITSYNTTTKVAEGTFKFSAKGETDGTVLQFTEGNFKVPFSN
ncbi:MAG TPA: Calx-beta domain-containing protein [Chryseolinea sp.]